MTQPTGQLTKGSQPLPLDAGGDFLPRVLRGVAGVTIAYGAVAIVDYAVRVFVFGMPYPNQYALSVYQFQQVMEIVYVGLSVMLVVGAVALWRWKSWGRTVLLVWVGLAIVFGFISLCVWSASYLKESRTATTQTAATMTPLGYYVWMMFSNFLARSMFPALIGFILLQPRVAKYWAQKTGGFEVVPFAQTVSEASP